MSFEGDESTPYEQSFNRFSYSVWMVASMLRDRSGKRLDTCSTATRLQSTFVACSGTVEG
jgi:hypothetical protein